MKQKLYKLVKESDVKLTYDEFSDIFDAMIDHPNENISSELMELLMVAKLCLTEEIADAKKKRLDKRAKESTDYHKYKHMMKLNRMKGYT